MALAHLEILDYVNNAVQLKIDIGKNKYYQFSIGANENTVQGIQIIENAIKTSKILGPLKAESLGRTEISIPQNTFDKKNNKIQLISYQDKWKKGIAFSDILTVQVNSDDNYKKNELNISRGLDMMQDNYRNTTNSYNTSFSIKENKMSDAMFLAGLLPMLGPVIQGLLPMLGTAVKGALPGLISSAPNIIGSLLGGLMNSQPTGQIATKDSNKPIKGNDLTQLLNSPEITALLQNLLRQTLNSSSSSPAAAKAKSLQLQLNNNYSEAKIAPAILAALPALLPILQQLLSPETIGKVLDQPQKMIGAVTDGIVKLGELGIASHEQDLQHLRALNPGTGPAVDSLLASLSMAIIENNKLISYKSLKSVKITFTKVVTVDCEGKNSLVYNFGGNVSFPVKIETPKPIGNCILQLSIKDVKTSKIVLIKNIKYKSANDIQNSYPSIEQAEYKILSSNNDYLVSISIIFKNKAKENIGTYASEVIHFTNSHMFASVRGKGESIALNDVQVHRAFWHKIWQAKFSKEIKRSKIHVKYYCILINGKEGIGKMETIIKPVISEDEYEKSMLMKSGIKINIADLNKLIPLISNQSMLQENQLNAISSPDFILSYNTLAQNIIRFNGFENEVAMLWVFPELSMHEIVLKKINKTNEYGMVEELVDDIVQFPLPTSLYFIGTKTT